MGRPYTKEVKEFLSNYLAQNEDKPVKAIAKYLNENHRDELGKYGFKRVAESGLNKLRRQLGKKSKIEDAPALAEARRQYQDRISKTIPRPSRPVETGDPISDSTAYGNYAISLREYAEEVDNLKKIGNVGIAKEVYIPVVLDYLGKQTERIMNNIQESKTIEELERNVIAVFKPIETYPGKADTSLRLEKVKEIKEEVKPSEKKVPKYMRVLETTNKILDNGQIPYASAVAKELGIETNNVSGQFETLFEKKLVEKKVYQTPKGKRTLYVEKGRVEQLKGLIEAKLPEKEILSYTKVLDAIIAVYNRGEIPTAETVGKEMGIGKLKVSFYAAYLDNHKHLIDRKILNLGGKRRAVYLPRGKPLPEIEEELPIYKKILEAADNILDSGRVPYITTVAEELKMSGNIVGSHLRAAFKKKLADRISVPLPNGIRSAYATKGRLEELKEAVVIQKPEENFRIKTLQVLEAIEKEGKPLNFDSLRERFPGVNNNTLYLRCDKLYKNGLIDREIKHSTKEGAGKDTTFILTFEKVGDDYKPLREKIEKARKIQKKTTKETIEKSSKCMKVLEVTENLLERGEVPYASIVASELGTDAGKEREHST